VDDTLLDEVIETDYGQFDLAYSEDAGFDGDHERYFSGQVNGLVGAADPSGVYVNLARRSGGSHVRIVLRLQPAEEDPAWEDVVEVSTTIPPPGSMGWLSWAGESGGELPLVAPGDYRMRVSARGRDVAARDEFAEGVVDNYLIELWPAPFSSDAVVRVGSANARYWHEECGSRR
jgi:hypothetical protein